MIHLVAGFESQIAAQGAALAVADAARSAGTAVAGGALARRDSERAIHVSPLWGLELPAHVLRTLDTIVDEDGARALFPGQSALVLSLPARDGVIRGVVGEAGLERLGALWVSFVPSAGADAPGSPQPIDGGQDSDGSPA